MHTCGTGHRKGQKAVKEDETVNKEMGRKSRSKQRQRFPLSPPRKHKGGSSGIAPLILKLSN